ncbi:VOC family protein [Embleya sp. MST-111070]|uniref:VOC family protein n=1 Tax=Embleya sp. MST-111070 TaxID=3398231 RepID=UPI003F73A352
MPVQLNHTIVVATDKRRSAAFLAHVLGLKVGTPYGPFLPVDTANGVALDFWDAPGKQMSPQHFAFLVEEAEFDAIMDRLRHAGVTVYADPHRRLAGRINTWNGGRGAFFADPDGHNMEIITRPYT